MEQGEGTERSFWNSDDTSEQLGCVAERDEWQV